MTSTLLAGPWVPPDRTEMADPGNVMFESSVTEQVDNPDEAPISLPEPRGYRLPDPSVGGIGASSKNRIGWSSGIVGLRQRRIPLTGRIFTAPPIKAEPVQGRVGQGTHADRLQAGVRQQMTQYDGSLAANAASFVGNIAS